MICNKKSSFSKPEILGTYRNNIDALLFFS